MDLDDNNRIADFLHLAIDQEIQAVGEGDREDTSWQEMFRGAKFDAGLITLADGRGIRVSAIVLSKALMIKRRLAEAREGIMDFTMEHVQAYCLDPERKKKWNNEVFRPFYIPLSRIMGDKAEDADVEAGEDKAIDLMKKIQAKVEELDLVNIAEGLTDMADVK